MIPWSAAVVNWIWEGERKLPRARVGLPAVLAVAAGAEQVFWAEAAVGVAKQDEADFVRAASDFAGDAGIYFVPAFWVVTESFPEVLAENKLLWIDPSGRVVTEYYKSIPAPGEPVVPGDGSVPIIDTPFGRIAR